MLSKPRCYTIRQGGALTGIRAAIALVLTCMSAVAAQEPAVFRASTDVVLVPVSVTDQNGRFVRGLTSAHFEILEDGARPAVKQFSAERVPVSLAILLDISGSMAQNPQQRLADDARWADTRRALALLLTRLGAADEVLFAVFNEQVAASPWTQESRQRSRHVRLAAPGRGHRPLGGGQCRSRPYFRPRGINGR